MLRQPYQAYKQQSVMTMTQAEMLTMLYDGILKEVYLTKAAFAQDPLDIAEVNRSLQKAQRILSYLKTSVDSNYDIAKNLYTLYDYCNWILIQVNVKKETSRMDEVVDIISQLRETYIQADKSLRVHATEGENKTQAYTHSITDITG